MSATVTLTQTEPVKAVPNGTSHVNGKEEEEPYKYSHLMPVWSATKYPPLEPFVHEDPGMRALKHPNQREFLDKATVIELTPTFGSDVRGVNLATLDDRGRDQLALEVARRGVIVFRDQQEFIDAGPEMYTNWGRYFGRLHIHPSSGHPEGFPEIHLVYKAKGAKASQTENITSIVWHSDFSYEEQPPGLTTFFLLSQPPTGGDTLYSSQVSNLKKLSPSFVGWLKTLYAVHTGTGSLRSGKSRGAILRRDPIDTAQPVVRRHPVTGEEALYVNPQFTRSIVGLKKEESDNLLNFLYDHIAKAGDTQARIKWSPNSIVVWDNRVTAHTAMSDFTHLGAARHGARVMAQAEKPIPALDGASAN